MDFNDYLERKTDSIARWTNEGLRAAVMLAIREAMHDQRHACAEALTRCSKVRPDGSYHTLIQFDEAHQAIMNAEPKE